jgi:hypothetical protein
MTNQQRQEQQPQQQPVQQQQQEGNAQHADQGARQSAGTDVDGLKDKKPEELTPEELRLMADTMPGEGPGD